MFASSKQVQLQQVDIPQLHHGIQRVLAVVNQLCSMLPTIQVCHELIVRCPFSSSSTDSELDLYVRVWQRSPSLVLERSQRTQLRCKRTFDWGKYSFIAQRKQGAGRNAAGEIVYTSIQRNLRAAKCLS